MDTMPFFKKNKNSTDKETTLLDLKVAIKKIDNSIKKKENGIDGLKRKAMVALSNKRESLARTVLAKKLKQEKSVEKLYNIQRKLSEQIDAIQEAETMQVATKALSSAVGVLNRYAKVIEELNVQEIIAESEESMAIIEDASDMMADDTMDMLIEDEISSELEELQAEVALEMGTQLTLAPETGEVGNKSVAEVNRSDSMVESDSDEVKKELERLKKELDLA
ncbi:hypothetical protein GF325_04745 [Candidatus Bathyarchaeota archaeon]|nr:hypothetical protein [Candidatus Bathyarchaeota archaeon]